MFVRKKFGPLNRVVEEWMLTTQGVADVYTIVNRIVPPGVRTTIVPSEDTRKKHQMYRAYHVTRRPPGAPDAPLDPEPPAR
jgi:hypothetical protein